MAQTDTDSALRRRRRHRLGQVAPGPAVRAGGGQHPDTGARARMRPDCRDCRAAGTSADRFHPRWRAGHAAGFRARGFRVMGIITWSSRCQIARCMLMRNAPRPQGNGCSRRRSPVGQSADPRSRLTSRHTARRCCMTTCPAPWLGPLRHRPVPHGPKAIPAESGASSFLALIRGSSSPLSKAPRCAHKRCLRPSEPLRGRCSPFEPSGPRHGTERLIRGGPGAGCAADLADLAQQLCLGIYRRLAMLGAEGDLP